MDVVFLSEAFVHDVGCTCTTKFVDIEISLIRCLRIVWLGIHVVIMFSSWFLFDNNAKDSREEILTSRNFFSVNILTSP